MKKPLSFDTETGGLKYWLEDEQAFMAQTSEGHGASIFRFIEHPSEPLPVGRDKFLEVIRDHDPIIAFNLPFDEHQVRFTLHADPFVGKETHDVDLLSRVCHPKEDPKDKRDLDTITERFLGKRKEVERIKALVKEYNEWVKTQKHLTKEERAKLRIGALHGPNAKHAYLKLWKFKPSEFEIYGGTDADITFDLYNYFIAELGDLKPIYELERQVSPILIHAEERGVRLDQDAVARLRRKYETELHEVHAHLVETLGEQALGGAGSQKALPEALINAGVPLYKMTPSGGNYSTNKNDLLEFAADHPVIRELFNFRRLEKFIGTYIETYEGVDILHPTINQLGAKTGRMSSERPNLQNVPKRTGKEMRSVIIPRPGMCFVVCDYDAIEARILADYLGDEEYQRLVSERDPHAWLASVIWGGTPEDYAKGGPKDLQRTGAKTGTYAIGYGAGGPRMQEVLMSVGMYVDVDEARRIVSVVRKTLPNYQHFVDKIERTVTERNDGNGDSFLMTRCGRKIPCRLEKAYAGVDYVIQGTAADVMKKGLVYTDELVRPLGAHILLVVHDEIVTEAPIEVAEEVLRKQKAAMEIVSEELDLHPRLTVTGSITTESYAKA